MGFSVCIDSSGVLFLDTTTSGVGGGAIVVLLLLQIGSVGRSRLLATVVRRGAGCGVHSGCSEGRLHRRVVSSGDCS